ncbi:hypothetical protein [Desulfoplanes sp.]
MNATFFGQFLLDHGLVSQEQLDEAISFQKENNSLLGSLALNKGFLTREQVLDIVREQQHSHEKFGELATARGYLSDGQVRDLLASQGQNHVFLGEALTRRQYLDIKELNRQLNLFNRKIQQNESSLRAILESLDGRHVFCCAYEMTREYLYRLGYAAHVRQVTNILPTGNFDHVFFMTLVAPDRIYYLGVYLSDVLAYQIAYSKQPTTMIPTREPFKKEVARLFCNLNLIICEEMGRKGIDLEVGDPRFLPPEDVPAWTCLHVETLIETFYVVLGAGPVPEA